MSKEKTPVYEIGELDKTRQNLGKMDNSEAQRMAKVLGGTVGVERAKRTGTVISRPVSSSQSSETVNNSTTTRRGSHSNSSSDKQTQRPFTLPLANLSEEKLFYNILTEYEICKKASLVKVIFSIGKVKATYLSPYFVKKSVQNAVKQICIFVDVVQKLLNNATPEYKTTIMTDEDMLSKTITSVYRWNTLKLIELSSLLDKNPKPTIEDSMPFIKELFRYIMKFYLLGESKMVDMLKVLYANISEQKPAFKSKNAVLAKQAASSWVYISEHVIHRMYPLLMRLTSNQYTDYANYYSKNSQKIFPFLEITKFDIISPEKNIVAKKESSVQNVQKKEKEVARGEIHKSILQSLSVLNNLFPNAGWSTLDRNPDMYGYFKTQFLFPETFSLLSPQHPLQITLVLLKIMEDFFSGIRNINFDNPAIATKASDFFDEGDSFYSVLCEWPYYCNELFNKELFPELREFVYRTESQQDFAKSKYGKKQLSNWLWKIKYYFLPHLEFDIVFLERNGQAFQTKPLARRIHQTTLYLSELIKNAEKDEGQITLLETEYKFEVTTPISFRLNVLLHGKKTKINLLKYALHVIRVLDWWLNDSYSLAYECTSSIPYRTTGTDLIENLKTVNHKEMFLAYTKKRLEQAAVKQDSIGEEQD